MKLSITNEEQTITIPIGTLCSGWINGQYENFYLSSPITAKIGQRDKTNYYNIRRVYDADSQHWFWVYCVEVKHDDTI